MCAALTRQQRSRCSGPPRWRERDNEIKVQTLPARAETVNHARGATLRRRHQSGSSAGRPSNATRQNARMTRHPGAGLRPHQHGRRAVNTQTLVSLLVLSGTFVPRAACATCTPPVTTFPTPLIRDGCWRPKLAEQRQFRDVCRHGSAFSRPRRCRPSAQWQVPRDQRVQAGAASGVGDSRLSRTRRVVVVARRARLSRHSCRTASRRAVARRARSESAHVHGSAGRSICSRCCRRARWPRGW
jgi:hypothetical protein